MTLIIGPVGAGKSTYLKHFELIAGKEVLAATKTRWIYIDFEGMGQTGSPREFVYSKLIQYVQAAGDYGAVVEPAYREEIAALARGPLAPIFKDKQEFNRRVADHIMADMAKIEPYVDKVLGYLARTGLCVIVLDNSDLYENDKLETVVFSEGLAISKRLHCHVFVALRDKTFVKHRTDSSFDAYELRKLWLDPPPFATVLSRRLTYAKKILSKKHAKVLLANGMWLNIPDVSVFFDIVQRSVLKGRAGTYVEAIADSNIRKGLGLLTTFLTSGHIQADRAVKSYMDGNTETVFPFHEVFKGTMLGQWRYYKEDRSECVNLFDSHLGSHRLRLLRLHLLSHIVSRAQNEDTLEVSIKGCIELFSQFAASKNQVIAALTFIAKTGLVRTVGAKEVSEDEAVVVTRAGAYYMKHLIHTLAYVEACMLDTAIDSESEWENLREFTLRIEEEGNIIKRLDIRAERAVAFLRYLDGVESKGLEVIAQVDLLRVIPKVLASVERELRRAKVSASKYYA